MPNASDEQGQNERVAQVIADVWSSGDVDALDEILDEDIVAHIPGMPEPVRGREAYKDTVRGYHAAFPDFTAEIHDVIAKGDNVVQHYTVQGTHEGNLMGIEPTGNTVEVSGIAIARVEDGTVVEETNIGDMLGMFQQLGVVELPEMDAP